jgi:hypothetical protein
VSGNSSRRQKRKLPKARKHGIERLAKQHKKVAWSAERRQREEANRGKGAAEQKQGEETQVRPESRAGLDPQATQ